MDDSVEIVAVREYIAQCPPFDQLSGDHLALASRKLFVSYHRAGSELALDYENPRLYLVRAGAFEVRTTSGELVDRVGPGNCFGYPSLLTGDETDNQLLVIEDGLLYELDDALFRFLRTASRPFDRFFNRAHAKRLRHAVRFREQHSVYTQAVSSLSSRAPIVASPTDTVADAARIMTAQRVSSVMIVDEDQKLCGLITDRDLRSRVVAEALDFSTPAAAIMTTEIESVSAESLVFEAIMLMTTHNIHHLPVLEHDEYCE